MGNLAKIQSLLLAGISCDITDGSKLEDTLLHWACSFQNIEAVRKLLVEGCAVNRRNANGQSALHLACKVANRDIIIALLNAGADKSLVDNVGKTVLDMCNASVANEISILIDSTVTKVNDSSSIDFPSDEKKDEIDIESFEDIDAHRDQNGNTVLVLWPPVQYQQRILNDHLAIMTDKVFYICVSSEDIDIFPLLTWSGLIDLFDKYVIDTLSLEGSFLYLKTKKYDFCTDTT
jgi:hypothetical protein